MKIVGVTSCIAGLAHTPMAAKSLEKEGRRLGHQIKIEQQGAMGIINKITEDEITAADFVLIAAEKGLASGFTAGLIASLTGSGFLGAVVGGLLAGYSSEWVSRKIQITGSAASSVPLIILPFITVGLQVVIMLLLLGDALSWVNISLMAWVQHMTQDGTNTVVLAAVLGGMICFDLGGPVNKAAWGTGNVLFLSGVYLPAILVNVAIITPPLGYAAARFLRPNNFNQTLKEAGIHQRSSQTSGN